MTRIFFLILPALLLAACSAPETKLMQAETLAAVEPTQPVIIIDEPIKNARQKALRSYQSLLQTNPNASSRPEIIRRIADLQVELGESVALPEEGNQTQIVEYKKTIDKHYSQAVGFYQRLLQEYPDSEAAPSVYYQLAKTYEQQGNTEDILATLNELVKKYPNLEGLDEVHFRRAEIYFANGELSNAEKAYAQVIKIGSGSSYYERSLYKRGWTLFKQNRFDAGIAEFVRLFDLTLPRKDEGYFEMQQKSRTDRELLSDALRAVSLSMSYLDGPESIPQYFSGANKRIYEDLVYGSLAAHYFEKQRYADSAETELEFVRQHPQSRQAPLFQHRAIQAFERANLPEKVLQGKRDYILLYEARHKGWKITDANLQVEILQHLENYLTELAKYSHSLAQNEKNKRIRNQHYQEAVRWYGKYLTHFKLNENAPDIHFLMAEALFESERYQQATFEYEQVAYKYKPHKKSSVAGYAALLAYDKHQETLPPLPSRDDMLKASKTQKKAKESDSVVWKRQGIASARYFYQQFPEHKNAVTVLARAANDLYELGESAETVVVASQVVQLNPPATPELRFSAWTVLAHSEYEQAHFAESEIAYGEVLKLLKKNDKRRKGFVELLAASVYRQGEISRDKKEYDLAVAHFLRVARVAPESPIRVSAEYDAATVLLETKQWDRAIKTLTRFRATYPNHKLQGDVTQNLAVAYLNSGKKLDAAREFGRLGRETTNPQFKREAVLQSAELYEEGGATNEAAATYANYVKAYPEPFDEHIELHQKLIDIHTSLGNKQAVSRWRQRLVVAEKRGGKKRSPRSKYLAAHAQLKLAEPAMKSYQAVKLTAPLKASLARKKSQMQTALKLFSDAAAYGVEDVSTASTYYTGEIYRSLSESLMNSERPKGLSALETEQYDILLEDQAFPFEEQAIEVHEINIARLPKGSYDDWIKKSLAVMAKLLPARYGKAERGEPYVQTVE